MDRLTKSAHFLAVRMTFTLEEFCRLYIREIVRLHGVLVSIILDKDPYGSLLEELLEGHGYTVDDEYCVSFTDGWSVGEDHTGVRGHATGMRPRSQG